MKKKPQVLLVSAALEQSLNGETPDSIVFMPKGEWKINPTVDGKAGTVEVLVDSDAAKILQKDLDERLKQTVRPIAGFDHKPGPASFLPKAIKWDDNRGVIIEVDWTKSGGEAVKGRDYSYFSPTFLLQNKKVIGLPKSGEIGSLTNNPAFTKIERIAASADLTDVKPMNKVANKLVELQVITAQQAESDDEDLLIRAIDGLHGTLVLAQKANELLKKENTDLQLKVQAVQMTEAEQVIQAAIETGAIPAKDEGTIQFFKEQYLAHPEQTKKVLASLNPNPALAKDPVIKVKAGDTKIATTDGPSIMAAQKRAVREIQETQPGLSWDTAFNKAREKHPELFVEA